MKNLRIVHRIKLKDYNLRVLVNILNEARLRQRVKDENKSATCDLICVASMLLNIITYGNKKPTL